jgi:hypothetical protein
MNIMNFYAMESEEFPMSSAIIAREQHKDSHLKELIKRSDKFSERTKERFTVITYEKKIYTTITQKENSVLVSHILTTPRYNTHGIDPDAKPNLAQHQKGCRGRSQKLSRMTNRQKGLKEIW